MDARFIRADFPILNRTINGKPLVYLDNAATTQKPRAVIEALTSYYENDNANVHRALHALGERATELYEGARTRVAEFIGADAPEQLIFTRNATEAINLVAYGWARVRLHPGDEIITTPMEHHSNLVPWQQAARTTGAVLKFIDLTPEGRLEMESFHRLLGPRTRLVALTHTSNVLGTINPVREICRQARAVGARVLVDGAQSVPHIPVDVNDLGCDFLAFSSHKMLGPTGIGALWGRREALEETDPFLFGGDMIASVQLDRATWADLPCRFEAGTPNIAGAVGWAAAVDYLAALGLDRVFAHEQELTRYAFDRLATLGDVEVYGPPLPRGGLVSFNIRGIHPHDVATVLNDSGVAIRAGHHCAQPLMSWLEVPATNRASFYIYNTTDDVDRLVDALARTKEFFRHVAF